MADAGIILQQRAPVSAIARHSPAILLKYRTAFVCASLIAADVAAVIFSAKCADAISGNGATLREYALTTALLFVALASALGLYATPSPSSMVRLRIRTYASLGAVGLEFFITARAGTPIGFVSAICETTLLVTLGHYLEAALRAALIRAGWWTTTAVVVHCDEKGRKIANLLSAHPEFGLSPIGFVTSPGQHENTDMASAYQPLPSLGTTASLGRLSVQTAIFTSREEMAHTIDRLRGQRGLPRLLLLEDVADLGTFGIRPHMLGDAIGFEAVCGCQRAGSQAIKRAIDFCVAIPLALITLPIVAILAGLVVLVSPGAPFYLQERVGRNGKPIRVLKLRTMYADAETRLQAHLAQDPNARAEWERFFKLKNDPRVLPFFGNFVRRSSLDELPQFWNVICGDMSLVGPRPFPAYHVRAFDPEFQALRASIKPGLTGLWQISFRSNGDIGVQRAQDSFYINNWSFWLDLYILLQTPPAVLRGDGAR
jgi:lipopolysaccharide/colanic/teichoic acid biosynthesis glycosyltransferase